MATTPHQILIGIDPGKRGAVCVLRMGGPGEGGTCIHAAPLFRRGAPICIHPAVPPLPEVFRDWCAFHVDSHVTITCENPFAKPGQSSSAAMAQGVCAGACLAYVGMMGAELLATRRVLSVRVCAAAPSRWHRLAIPRKIRCDYAGEPKAAARAWVASILGLNGIHSIMRCMLLGSGLARIPKALAEGVIDAAAIALAGPILLDADRKKP